MSVFQKRVSRITRQYYWTPIKDTSFTLVVTFPESYGVNRIEPPSEDEIHLLVTRGFNLTDFFSGNHWSIHPDWLYCRSKYKTYMSAESELKDILKTVGKQGWKWPLNRSPPSPEHTANMHYCEYCACLGVDSSVIRLRRRSWLLIGSVEEDAWQDGEWNEFFMNLSLEAAHIYSLCFAYIIIITRTVRRVELMGYLKFSFECDKFTANSTGPPRPSKIEKELFYCE